MPVGGILLLLAVALNAVRKPGNDCSILPSGIWPADAEWLSGGGRLSDMPWGREKPVLGPDADDGPEGASDDELDNRPICGGSLIWNGSADVDPDGCMNGVGGIYVTGKTSVSKRPMSIPSEKTENPRHGKGPQRNGGIDRPTPASDSLVYRARWRTVDSTRK